MRQVCSKRTHPEDFRSRPEQRHHVRDLFELIDVLVPAGGAQRTHAPDDELREPSDVQRSVLRLLLDQRQVQSLLDAGAQTAVFHRQEGQQSLEDTGNHGYP